MFYGRCKIVQGFVLRYRLRLQTGHSPSTPKTVFCSVIASLKADIPPRLLLGRTVILNSQVSPE